ncbi:MAG TPA: lipid-binding SYLF domain-containing protein [Woeseiaceae bacterium]|nr:lipid-binding SYLF domain-containing protein [Woeseiaceae bacterium]
MRIRLPFSIILLSLAAAMPAAAATPEEERVAAATDVIDQLLRIPEQSVPDVLLSRAYAIAVIPNVVKIGFGLGARRGKGVLVVRQDNGTWSNPAFVTLTGGSFGWQIGAQSTDIILVFKTREGVDNISKGKLTLGADASIAAGPVGRHTGIATDIEFQAEVFSYSRSRGLFAGVALEGAGVTMDRGANAAFYGSSTITPDQIFASSGNSAPAVANNFVQVLSAETRQLPAQPGMDADANTPGSSLNSRDSAARAPESSPAVRTYGIGDPDSADTGEEQYDNF